MPAPPLRLLALAAAFWIAADQPPALTGPSAALYEQAKQGKFFKAAAKLKPEIWPTPDARSFVVVWAPKTPSRWIVTLHGTRGFATDQLALWAPVLKDKGIGVLALQWWLGAGEDYLTPVQIYREMETALQRQHAMPGTVLLHGFSRGASNVYAVAAIDAGPGNHYAAFAVAESGGAALDYPPTKAIADGAFGPRPFGGVRWITAAGGRDPNPARDGFTGMRRAVEWLRSQGATVVLSIEDKGQGHGPLGRSKKDATRVVDLFLGKK